MLNTASSAAAQDDWRDLSRGQALPTARFRYTDQPYVLRGPFSEWICMLSVGTLGEGVKGSDNFTAVTVSTDRGKTWSAPVRCNKTYAVPLLAPSGRLYSLTPGRFTWSDDGGKTWSQPQAIAALASQMPPGEEGHEGPAWTVSMPVVHEGVVFSAYARIGLAKPPRKTDVFFMRSDNLLTEPDATKVRWERLPAGETGLRGPDWDKPEHRSEEPHLAVLSDGTFYCVWRTDQGHIGRAVSTDAGRTWSKADYVRFTDGRLIKHPLACPSLWKTSNGKYLLWIHNVGIDRKSHYAHRNPAWLCGGSEQDGPDGRKTIAWSQPEALLYTENYLLNLGGRISYPGLLEADGRYWIFETQKTAARFHEVPAAFIESLWRQHDLKEFATRGLALALDQQEIVARNVKMPRLPSVAGGGGFTVDLVLKLDDLAPEQVLLDSRDASGRGIWVSTTKDQTLRLDLYDGKFGAGWDCDPGQLTAGKPHRVTFIVDGGPKIISVVVDGRLNDGGQQRQYGWGRIGRYDVKSQKATDIPGDVTGGDTLRLAPALHGKLLALRLYDRYLLTGEALGNQRASEQR